MRPCQCAHPRLFLAHAHPSVASRSATTLISRGPPPTRSPACQGRGKEEVPQWWRGILGSPAVSALSYWSGDKQKPVPPKVWTWTFTSGRPGPGWSKPRPRLAAHLQGLLAAPWLSRPALTEFGSEKQLVLVRISGPSQMETVPPEESAGNLSGNALGLGPLACLAKAKLTTLRQGMLQMERDSWLQTEILVERITKGWDPARSKGNPRNGVGYKQ
uniref:uncharacterized protein LOC143308669 n=1 Tax=Arvicanthis niloticus TaxID=61156 RepID=UPI00402BF31E